MVKGGAKQEEAEESKEDLDLEFDSSITKSQAIAFVEQFRSLVSEHKKEGAKTMSKKL